MTNPWVDLPQDGPFVLPCDRAKIEQINASLAKNDPCRIRIDGVLPEPFIGVVNTAPVVVLQLNPGFRDADVASHADPDFRAALLANLRHARLEWPFHFFDPRFREEHPGGVWWCKKTRQLAKAVLLELLARNMAVIEWFPYKSHRFKSNCRVPSQQYGFSLVQAAIDRNATIVVSRSVRLWEESVRASDLPTSLDAVVRAKCLTDTWQLETWRGQNAGRLAHAY